MTSKNAKKAARKAAKKPARSKPASVVKDVDRDLATAVRLLRETAPALPCFLDADGFDVTEVDHATLIRIYGIGGEADQLESRYPQRPAKKGGK